MSLKGNNRKQSILYLVELALLTAIVLVLQLTGFAVRLPFLTTPVSLVGIPIALGAMLLGPKAGAWLGFVFGAEVAIVLGMLGQDPFFTGILFQDHPILTTLLCVGKGTLAGLASGLLFKYLKKGPAFLRVILASAAVPVVNTAIFILGSYTMMDTFKSNFLGDGTGMFYFLVIGCAGVNFLCEFAINTVFSPVLHRLLDILGKRLQRAA